MLLVVLFLVPRMLPVVRFLEPKILQQAQLALALVLSRAARLRVLRSLVVQHLKMSVLLRLALLG